MDGKVKRSVFVMLRELPGIRPLGLWAWSSVAVLLELQRLGVPRHENLPREHVHGTQEDQQRAPRGTPVCKGGEREGISQQRGNRKGRMRHNCRHRIFQKEV